jgi:hypothetical protein
MRWSEDKTLQWIQLKAALPFPARRSHNAIWWQVGLRVSLCENAKTWQRYLRSLIMPELRVMMKRVWRILPTVIVVSLVVSLVVCAIVWMIDAPHDAVAPIVAVVVCIMFLPRRRSYRICS